MGKGVEKQRGAHLGVDAGAGGGGHQPTFAHELGATTLRETRGARPVMARAQRAGDDASAQVAHDGTRLARWYKILVHNWPS
ncbi:hypothetical protein [Corynebacterium sp. Marseille-Q2516]